LRPYAELVRLSRDFVQACVPEQRALVLQGAPLSRDHERERPISLRLRQLRAHELDANARQSDSDDATHGSTSDMQNRTALERDGLHEPPSAEALLAYLHGEGSLCLLELEPKRDRQRRRMSHARIGEKKDACACLHGKESELPHEDVAGSVFSGSLRAVFFPRIGVDDDHREGRGASDTYRDPAHVSKRRAHEEEAVQLDACHRDPRRIERPFRVDPGAPCARVFRLSGSNRGEGEHRPPSERVRCRQLDDPLRKAPVGEDTLELRPEEGENGSRALARRRPEEAFP
jgi:hypothetical protein